MPGGRPRQRIPRNSPIVVWCNDDELEIVRAHARACGYRQLAPFLRDAILSEIDRSRAAGWPPPPPPRISQARVRRVASLQARKLAR